MGFNFGFFGTPEHRVFNYKPRYYDEEKDELRKKFGKVDGSLVGKDKEYVPGSYLKGSFRDGNYQRQKSEGSRMQKLIGMVALLLAIVALIFIAKCWPAVTGQL